MLRRPTDDEKRVGVDDLVVLGLNERRSRLQQRLLSVEHVESRALADLGLFAHAGERDFVGGDRRARGAHHADRGLVVPQAATTAWRTWLRTESVCSSCCDRLSLA